MNERLKSYQDRVVWPKRMAEVKLIYPLTRSSPAGEKFCLISQMRRAAMSVPANLAEDHARNTTGELIPFSSHAEGSLAELEPQFILAVERTFCSSAKAQPLHRLIEAIQKVAPARRRSLASRP